MTSPTDSITLRSSFAENDENNALGKGLTLYPYSARQKIRFLIIFLLISILCFFLWTSRQAISFSDNRKDLTSVLDQIKSAERLIPMKAVKYLDKLTKKPLTGDIKELTLHLRIFKRLRKAKFRFDGQIEQTELNVLNTLTKKLFPWYKNVDLMVDDPAEKANAQRGIVVCTGKKHLAFAVHVISSIRLWNCTLPIEVFHIGADDMSPNAAQLFSNFKDVSVVNIEDRIDQSILKLKGWDIKPFAILTASFKEVLLIDADTVFAQKPDIFFEKMEYDRDGALFFIDRIFLSRTEKPSYAEWFSNMFPLPLSERLTKSYMYRGLTNYEQESGIVLMNKAKRIYGLLGACLLNVLPFRDEIHSKTHGDKETFWLGFEMSEDSYDFLDHSAGIVGVAPEGWDKKKVRFCGHLAHFDREGALLWFNDAIVTNKNNNLTVGNFTHVVKEGRWLGLCMSSDKIQRIPDHQQIMIEKMKDLWIVDPLEHFHLSE